MMGIEDGKNDWPLWMTLFWVFKWPKVLKQSGWSFARKKL